MKFKSFGMRIYNTKRGIMKTLFAAVIILACISFPQEAEKQNMEHFIVLYTLGESWDTTKQAHEQLYFKEHSSHLFGLRKEKRILIGGRYSGTGMIIIAAESESVAHDLIMKDKAVENKIFNAEIFLFTPFYKGCLE